MATEGRSRLRECLRVCGCGILVCVVLAVVTFVVVAGLLALGMLAGIVPMGPGHAVMDMPPLYLEGKVTDSAGKPVAAMPLVLALSDNYMDLDVLHAAESRSEDLDEPGTDVANPSGSREIESGSGITMVKTGQDGKFEIVFPARSGTTTVAATPFFVMGDRVPPLNLFVVSKDDNGPKFFVQVFTGNFGTKIKIEPLSNLAVVSEGGEQMLTRKKDLPTNEGWEIVREFPPAAGTLTAEVERGKERDTLRLTLVVK